MAIDRLPARQRRQSRQALNASGSIDRSRVPRIEVQVLRSRMMKHSDEWLAVQPTPEVPSFTWGIPGDE